MEKKEYKILLIEDDKLDQTAFKRLVKDKKLPYDCTIAGSVSEAQSVLSRERFDVVIADYLLGDGTAFDILDLVESAPIIIVTGSGDEEVAVKAWKAGACDYLIKDIERNYLKAVPITVENAIKHKQIEEKLRLLSAAVTSTDDSVYITDMQNKIIFVNRAFCKTYGYKKEDVIGKDSNILWMGRAQSESTRSVFQVFGSTCEVGFYHKRKDGGIFPVSLSRSIIKDQNGKEIAVVGVARDISDRIEVEDELRAVNVQLAERGRIKSELAVTISVALRTFLVDLKDVIADAGAAVPDQTCPELRESLELTDGNIDRVVEIVGDFLDVSKSDAGEMELEQTGRRLQSAMSELLQTLSPVAAEKKD